MTKALLVLALAFSCGCIELDDERPSEVFTWVDDTGEVVSEGEAPFVVGGDGTKWVLDIETAQIPFNEEFFFVRGDCIGPAWLKARTPGEGLLFRTNPPAVQLEGLGINLPRVTALSEGGTCSSLSAESVSAAGPMVLEQDLAPAQAPPSLAFAPPLRQELR